jgi:hypothetical protein
VSLGQLSCLSCIAKTLALTKTGRLFLTAIKQPIDCSCISENPHHSDEFQGIALWQHRSRRGIRVIMLLSNLAP